MEAILDPSALVALDEPKQRQRSSDAGKSDKTPSEMKRAMIALGIAPPDAQSGRSAKDVARELWYVLRHPSFVAVWQRDQRMYRGAVQAAKHYENRSQQ
jgi:hypothetical protein